MAYVISGLAYIIFWRPIYFCGWLVIIKIKYCWGCVKLLQDSIVANSLLCFLLPIAVSQRVGFGSQASNGTRLRIWDGVAIFDHFSQGDYNPSWKTKIVGLQYFSGCCKTYWLFGVTFFGFIFSTANFSALPNGGAFISLEQMIWYFWSAWSFNAVRGLLWTVKQVMRRVRTGMGWIGGEWTNKIECPQC